MPFEKFEEGTIQLRINKVLPLMDSTETLWREWMLKARDRFRSSIRGDAYLALKSNFSGAAILNAITLKDNGIE